MSHSDQPTEHPRPPRGLFWSIRTRLTLYFILVFAVVLVIVELLGLKGVPFTSYAGRLASKRAEAFRSLDLVADLKKERLLRWLEERRDDAHVSAANPLVAREVARLRNAIRALGAAGKEDAELWAQVRKEGSYTALAVFLKSVQAAYVVYDRIQIADAQTGTVFVSTHDADLGTDISAHSCFIEAPRSPHDCLCDVHVPLEGRKPTFHVMRVIHSGAGEAMATLVVQVNFDDIVKPMLHTGGGLGQRGEALLVNRDVKIITSLKHALPDGTTAKPLAYRIQARPAMLAASGEEGIIEAEDYRGEPVLAAFRHIRVTPDFGWGMVVKRDKAELFAPMREEITYALLTGLLGVLAVVVLTTVVVQRFTGPILSLSRTADRVAQGDLGARASPTRQDEVGRLAKTFNAMIEQIQNWHRDLEAQVADRTAELNQANVELRAEIAERTRAEKALADVNRELAEKNREMESIVYVTSHDLRTPLVNIQGFSKELERACDVVRATLGQAEVPEDLSKRLAAVLAEDIPQALQYIATGAAKMDALLAGLLRLSRLGRAALQIERLDMNAMMGEIAESIEFQVSQAGATLQIDDLPPCLGDATQINQVFTNLLDNALKYLDPARPGKIRVSGREEAGRVVYAVRDNGVGIAQAQHEKIFEIFRRLAPTAGGGEGIGLTIVRRVLDRHRGEAWLESEPGQGTTFFVSLPIG